MNLANATGAAFRSDLNNALAAVASNNSDSSDPSTTFAYQWYVDTGDSTLKIRNAANNAYVNVSTVGGIGTANLGLAPTASPTFTGDVTISSTTALRVPVGTTAQRSGSAGNGDIRYNSTLSSFEVYAAGAWASIGGAEALGSGRLNINGAMQVAQRGTVVNAGNEYAGPDRYKFAKNDGAYTISQDTDAPSGQGFGNSWKADVTATPSDATGFVILEHKFEGQDVQLLKKGTSSAEKVTLQFWIKSTKTGTYVAELRDEDNTRHICQTYTVSVTNTWEKKTLTFAGDTTGVLGNDNGASFTIGWWLYAGSNFTSGALATSWAAQTNANRAVGQVNAADNTSNEIYITGVQLEVGEDATAFEHRSFGNELAKCQRYYNRLATGLNAPVCNLAVYATDNAYGVFNVPVVMRTQPTVDASDASGHFTLYSGGNGDTFDTFILSASRTNAVELRAHSSEGLSGAVAGHAAWAVASNAAAFIALSAEL